MLRLGELAEHYRRGIIEKGTYDFLAKGIELQGSSPVDIFRYDLGSDSVHLVGFFQSGDGENFEEKRQASSDWLEYFSDKGFNVSRSLKSDRFLSKGQRPEQSFQDKAYISDSISFEDKSEVITRLNPYFAEDLEEVLG